MNIEKTIQHRNRPRDFAVFKTPHQYNFKANYFPLALS